MITQLVLSGPNQAQLTSQLNAWKVGQVLEAVALSRPAAERLQIKIGGMELEARTQAPIQAGDKVMLKVLSVGDTPTLQVVPATTAAANAADAVNHAIRQLLPRQTSTPKVVASLVALLNGASLKGEGSEMLPPRTKGLIETLLSRIPTADKLADQAQLKQLVEESGLFRESRQLVGRPDQFDMKQALIQLARQLNEMAQQRQSLQAQNANLNQQQSKSAEQQVQNTNRPPVAQAGPLASPASAKAPIVSGGQLSAGTTATQPATSSGQPVAPTVTTAGQSVAGQGQTPGGQPTQPAVPHTQQQVVQQYLQQQPTQQQGARGVPERVDLLSFDELLLETRQSIDGGIARLILQQAQSLPQQGQDGLRWVLELPFRDGETYRSIPLSIEREAKRDSRDGEELGWRVELEFNFEPLGNVQARVLVRGDKVSASLWTEHSETAQLAESALPGLETALIAAGLEVGAITCMHGRREEQPNREVVNQSILNYRV